MNDENVAKKIENLNKRLDNARRIKADLEQKAAKKNLTKNEANDLRKFTQEVERCERQLSKMRATKQEVDRVLSNLSGASIQELKRTLAALNHEIESGSVKRGTEEWKKYQKAIKEVNTELKKVREEQEAVNSSSTRWGDFLKNGANLWMTIQGGIAAVTGLKSTVQSSVQAFAEMDEAEADVMKYTGMTKAQVEDLNEELKGMNTRTGREQLNALAGDAGRLGLKSKQEILEFVDAADKINIALGEDLGEDAVKNIGKLAMLFGEDQELGLNKAMLATGSAINELAQNSSSSETYILDFTARLAGVSKQANIAQANIMGYAAVLDESMLRDEMASTAMQQLIVKIFQDPARMAKAAGLEIQQFSELVRTDANAALLQFFDAMNARGGFDSLAPMFEEMHLNGQRAVGVLSAVAGKIDDVRARQELANKAYREGTSIQQEFDVKNNTVQAQLDKAKKNFHELAVSLGERLLPIMRDGIHLTSKIMSLTIDVIDFVGRYKTTIILLTTAIVAYTAVVKMSIIWDKLKILWTEKITVAAKKLWATLKANPYGILVAAVAAVVGIMADLLDKTDKVSAATKSLAEIEKSAAESIQEETKRLNELLAVAKNEKLSREQRQKALELIKKEYPQYLSQLSLETINTDNATRAIGRQISAMLLRNKIQKGLERITELDNKINAPVIDIDEGKGWIERTWNEGKQWVADAADWINNWIVDSRWLRGVSGGIYEDFRNEAGRMKAGWQKERDAIMREITGWQEELSDEGFSVLDFSGGGSGGGSSDGSGSGTGSGTGSGNTTDPRKEAAEKLAREAEIERTRQKMYYEAGISERREYEEQLLMIDEQLYTAQRDLYTNADQEWWQFESRRIDALQKWNKQVNDWSLEDLQRQQRAELDAEMQAWATELYAEEEHQRKVAEIKREYALREADFLETIGQGDEAERRRREVQEQDTKDMLQKRTKLMQQLAEMQKKYETETTEQTMETELQAAESLCQQLGIEEEKKQKLLKAIRDKYVADDKAKQEENERKTREYYESILPGGAEGATQKLLSLANVLSKIHEHLGTEGKWGWQEYAAVAVAAIDTVCATLSAASSYMQAAYDADAAKVEARYDREIKAAGSGTKRAKQLEEQKEKELAQIKNKYNKQAMAMELAQAVAGTAMAAINAYASAAKIPVIGWKLAPIAAAMATAAGLLQIATIKKQHEAQTAGYYEGGFTGGAQYRREAGIVHEGEFVANHQAVQNPSIMPVLRLIDQAQRQNRVANVSTADIVRSTGAAPSTAAQPTTVVVDTSSRRTAEAIEKLNRKLESPIETYVTIDGPQGLHKQYEHYKKLIAQG